MRDGTIYYFINGKSGISDIRSLLRYWRGEEMKGIIEALAADVRNGDRSAQFNLLLWWREIVWA